MLISARRINQHILDLFPVSCECKMIEASAQSTHFNAGLTEVFALPREAMSWMGWKRLMSLRAILQVSDLAKLCSKYQLTSSKTSAELNENVFPEVSQCSKNSTSENKWHMADMKLAITASELYIMFDF